MKKFPVSKNILTLLSVLSVLLVFSLVCMLCLLAMDKLGIDKLFGSSETEPESVPMQTEFPLPVHTEETSGASAVGGNLSALEKILVDIPYSDSYYIKIQVSVDETAGDGVPAPGTYEIWRFGDKYKIHRYNSNNEIEWMVTCDGDRLQVVDFTDLSNAYYSVSEGYSFESMAPLPELGILATEEHEIFEYSEDGDICNVAIEYPSISTVDNIVFSMSTGILHSFSRFQGSGSVWKIDLISSDLEFAFRDYMFRID